MFGCNNKICVIDYDLVGINQSCMYVCMYGDDKIILKGVDGVGVTFRTQPRPPQPDQYQSKER